MTPRRDSHRTARRSPLHGQSAGSLRASRPSGDRVDRQALAAQLDHAAPGGVLPRRALATGPARLGEQRQLPGPEVAHQRRQRRWGVPEPGGCPGQRRALEHIGADRLVPPLVDLRRLSECFPASLRGWFRCHSVYPPCELPDVTDPGGHRRDGVPGIRTAHRASPVDRPAPATGRSPDQPCNS